MPSRPFANVASCAYVRSGVVIDASKRITVEILATGSQRTNVRQIKYDITRFLDEQNSLLALFNPATQYSLIITDSDLIFDRIFYAGDIEIIRNVEGASSIAFYNQIYKPLIRICGGAFVSNAYSGLICPISRLTVLSNETRALTLTDFLEKRLPTTIGHDSFFSGNIIGRAQNGDPYNVIDNLVTLNTELVSSKEVVNIVSCTATADSWLITTDNQYNALQVVTTPAYNPISINALNKASPVFVTSTSITSSDDWQVATEWRISNTYWASAEQAYNSAGQGSQYLGIEYPDAVKMVSYKMDPNTRYTGAGAPLQWNISGSNNNSTFVVVKTFQFNAWQVNKIEEFYMSFAHVPYKYWRITITLIKTTGVAIHTTTSDISFISGWSVGMTSLLSAQPVTLNTFKLILGNSYGVVVSMLDTPIDWQFNLLLIKNGRIRVRTTMNTASANKFKQDSTNLARASYLPPAQASTYGESLGYTLDKELSRPNTMVFVDRSGQPVVAHRGSVTATDWLVDDALIAVGAHRNTDRLNLARSITVATEKKYGRPANSVGHSSGGRLAEQSGSGGQIVTINKAAGLGDIGRRQPSGTRQTDMRTKMDAVSALSRLGRRPESQGIVTQSGKLSIVGIKGLNIEGAKISDSFRHCEIALGEKVESLEDDAARVVFVVDNLAHR
ncbi:hypothetical protein T492DRAFT_849340 [Pavlovales sp. CCMP2436]|nr:hypothetical protein T492DRAFT_849340 [Pavlovales sp. CCMP2436]